MKQIVITIFLGLFILGNSYAENIEGNKSKVIKSLPAYASDQTKFVEEEFIFRELATLDKGRNSIKNAKKIIRSLRYHTADPHNSDGNVDIEKNIPAIAFILKSYDEDVIPLVLEYALQVQSIYLKRRAVYCIEKITEKSIQDFFNERFGKKVNIEKVTKLIKTSRAKQRALEAENEKQISFLLKNINEEENKIKLNRISQLKSDNVAFYFPVLNEALMNLKVPTP